MTLEATIHDTSRKKEALGVRVGLFKVSGEDVQIITILSKKSEDENGDLLGISSKLKNTIRKEVVDKMCTKEDVQILQSQIDKILKIVEGKHKS